MGNIKRVKICIVAILEEGERKGVEKLFKGIIVKITIIREDLLTSRNMKLKAL
jgi:hypothetical protein